MKDSPAESKFLAANRASVALLLGGFAMIYLFSTGLRAQGSAPDISPEIAAAFAAVPSPAVSDEFNESTLDTAKWAYRSKGGGWGTGPEYVAFVNEGVDSFVSIRGLMKESLGCGIVTKNEAHFGFYSMRWRTQGISPEFKTPWHPSVWMAGQNFASGKDARAIAKTPTNVEIDFIEFWHQPVWHSQTIAWDRTASKGAKTLNQKMNQKMRPELVDFPTIETGWQVHGLEYRPEYLQLWQQLDGKWRRIGMKIPINAEPTSKTSLNQTFASPGYWILSNKYHWEKVSQLHEIKGKPDLSTFRFEDSALQLDYFRYFPLNPSE